MIPTHCRHMKYPNPGTLDFPKTCAVGIAFDAVRLPGRNRLNGEPCTKAGRENGATCAKYAPWTAEEVAANEAEIDALMRAIDAGRCICGEPLSRAGSRFWCAKGDDDDHVSGFACSPKEGRG